MTDGRDLAAKKTKPGRALSASQARSNAAAAADAAPTDDECRGRNPGLRGAAPEYTRDYSATVGVRLLRTPSAIRCACTRIGNAVLSGTLDPKKANSALYAVAGAKAAMDLEQQAKALELEQQRVNIEAARSNIAAQLPANPAESMRAYLALMNGDDSYTPGVSSSSASALPKSAALPAPESAPAAIAIPAPAQRELQSDRRAYTAGRNAAAHRRERACRVPAEARARSASHRPRARHGRSVRRTA